MTESPLSPEDGAESYQEPQSSFTIKPPDETVAGGSYLPEEEAAADGSSDGGKTAITGGRNAVRDMTDTRTQKIKPPKEYSVMDGERRRLLKISCHKCRQKMDVTFLESFSHFDCPSCDTDIIVPKWFDNYLLEEPGGIGGMATVYRALDIALDREVAIKVLNSDVASERDRTELFLHEARTAATINHHAVIPIYTCGVFEGQPYIVMQYMLGGSLEAKLKQCRGLIPVMDVCKWMRDIAEGLDSARKHGIIHHDIKPGNIMLDGDGNPKIGDFGIAQAINDHRGEAIFEMTKSWISPHYVSPEKVSTYKEDHHGDIYSLGATFYHLVTGFTPFNNADVDELIKARLKGDPPPPHVHRDEVPPAISRLILAMMSRNPSDRPDYKEIVKGIDSVIKIAEKTKSLQQKKAAMSPAQTRLGQKPLVRPAPVSAAPASTKRRGCLFSLSYHIIILLAITALLFYGWKSGRLQLMMPFLPECPLSISMASGDRLPEASRAFAEGDVKKALQAAQNAFEGITEDVPVRSQAAVQLAFAQFLLANPSAPDECSAIAERLVAIESPDEVRISPSMEGLGSTPSQAIVLFLANKDVSKEELAENLKKSDKASKLAGELAVLLKSLRQGASRTESLSLFRKFKESSGKASQKLWSSAWERRLDIWEKALKSPPGASISGNIEPIFVDFNKAASEASGTTGTPGSIKSSPPPSEANHAEPVESKPAAVEPTSSNTPPPVSSMRVSQSDLKAASAPFLSLRPKPEGLDFTAVNIEGYLAKLPKEQMDAERSRSAVVSGAKDYLGRLIMRIPYETEDLKLKSGSLGVGVLSVSGKSLSFKSKSGQRRKLEWCDIPFEEHLKMLESYAKIRRQAMEGGALGADARLDLAWDYMRMAVLCCWYGRFSEAETFAMDALKTDGRVEKHAETLLLK